MKILITFLVALTIFPSLCFSQSRTFHLDDKKLKVEYLKRGDFYNHIIRIKGTLSGGRSCKEGALNLGVKGFERYTRKEIPVKNYKGKFLIKTEVTVPKKLPYRDVDIFSIILLLVDKAIMSEFI